ncbi:MAG: hypothetical protein GF350_13010 [Chitinivibrionales bacterium]|nr:hypothetical protein [Chitinivibrionales bacterium]
MVYSSLAPIYDMVMMHVRYDEWVGLIKRIAKKYIHFFPPKTFEIGGGTAVLGKKLVENGFAYAGSDFSPSMCREAGKKGCTYFCTDGRSLALKTGFDMIIFLYDGINYLMSLSEYTVLFHEVWNCLNHTGLFLFDITTRTNSLRYFRDYHDHEDFGEWSYTRHSYYNAVKHTQHNDFAVYHRIESSGLYEKTTEYHTQKLFMPHEILSAIPDDKFEVVGIWDGYSFREYSDDSERIHFLLRKISAV